MFYGDTLCCGHRSIPHNRWCTIDEKCLIFLFSLASANVVCCAVSISRDPIGVLIQSALKWARIYRKADQMHWKQRYSTKHNRSDAFDESISRYQCIYSTHSTVYVSLRLKMSSTSTHFKMMFNNYLLVTLLLICGYKARVAAVILCIVYVGSFVRSYYSLSTSRLLYRANFCVFLCQFSKWKKTHRRHTQPLTTSKLKLHTNA